MGRGSDLFLRFAFDGEGWARVAFASVVCLSGCAKNREEVAGPNLAPVTASTRQVAADLTDISAAVRNDVEAIRATLPAPEALPPLADLETQADRVDAAAETTAANAKTLEAEASKAVAVSADLRKVQDQLRKEKEESRRWYLRTLYSVALASLLGLSVSVALSFFGRLNVVVAATFAATFVGAMAGIWILSYLALIGGGVVLLLCGWFGWQIYVRQRALKQTVATVEKAKAELTTDQKITVFGDNNGHKGIAGEVQSPTTVKIVSNLRGKKGDH